jgi:hypothetical protein
MNENTMKRTFFSAACVAAAMTLTSIAPAYAICGSDPISGIDIIIKKNPGSQPIKPFEVDERTLAHPNELKGDDRAEFLMKVIAERTDGDERFVCDGTAVLGKQICSKCEIGPNIDVKFRSGEVT